jgi:hypothetical protein
LTRVTAARLAAIHVEARRRAMRKILFWFGWAVLFALPIAFVVQIWMIQDLPTIEPWKWAVPLAAVMVILLSRNRDDVLKHHLV